MLEETRLSPREIELRALTRAYLEHRLPRGSYAISLGMPGNTDTAFSRDLAAQGWVGMAISAEYSGGGRTAVDRLIVVEELLSRGAPVAYHWVADRQSGPSIEKYGTPEQRRAYLPGIVAGQLSFAIGMSEPEAGSDLSSLRSLAERVEGGWRINGTKVWTTGAARATHVLGLFRTSDDRQHGLTQFIIPVDAAGLTISPIEMLDGSRDFCELAFVDVFLGDEHRLGEVGSGWEQNTAELVLERGGVDRWMSAFPLVDRWREHVSNDPRELEDLGTITAQMWLLHAMSLSIARLVDEGQSPSTSAAMIKEMGTRFEQDCVEIVSQHTTHPPGRSDDGSLDGLLASALLVSPSWSIRGGTTEIMRSIIARSLSRGLGDRASFNRELSDMTDDFFQRHVENSRSAARDTYEHSGEVWHQAHELGLTAIAIPAGADGSDGSVADMLTVVMSAASLGVPLPLAEHWLGSWLLTRAGDWVATPLTTIVTPTPHDTLALRGGIVTGTSYQVPWGASATTVAAILDDESGVPHVVAFDSRTMTIKQGRDLAGLPSAAITVSGRPSLAVPAPDHIEYHWLGALCRAAQIAGALQSVSRLTIAYAGQRTQFSKPIASFQAVQQHLVTVAQASEAAHMAVSRALHSLMLESPRWKVDVCAAKVIANQSARAASRAAHQVHGAIGMTREYELHHLTSPLHLWRLQFGAERSLTRALGAITRNHPSLMDVIADENLALEVSWPT